jgi:DNA-binding GntR family transcriptional regulator
MLDANHAVFKKNVVLRERTMKKTKNANAYDTIKDLILRENFDRNAMLSISVLAEQIGMGRAPVSDAVKRLESEGLLVIKPRQGIVIYEMTVQEMKDINETRLLLEPYIMEKIAPSVTPDDITELTKYINDMGKCALKDDHYGFIVLDHGMHSYLYDLCENSCMADILKNLRDRMFTVGYKIIARREGRMQTTVQEHKDILLALKANDSLRAAEAVRLHLTNGSKLI